MSARTIVLTLYGSPTSGLALTVGESVAIDVSLQDPSTRLAVDLTGCTCRLSIAAVDIANNPITPALVAKTGTITAPATNGAVVFSLASGDTSALAPGGYMIDLWVTDASANRTAFMPLSRVTVTGAATT